MTWSNRKGTKEHTMVNKHYTENMTDQHNHLKKKPGALGGGLAVLAPLEIHVVLLLIQTRWYALYKYLLSVIRKLYLSDDTYTIFKSLSFLSRFPWYRVAANKEVIAKNSIAAFQCLKLGTTMSLKSSISANLNLQITMIFGY
jgi:hypothetical protein